MEEKERFEIHIYDDVCVDLYNNGVLDKSINDTYKLEKLLNQQDKRIRDLEAKLAESESKRKSLEEKIKFLTEETEENFVDGQKYNELKEQLAEKDKEIEQLKKFDDLNKTFFELFRTAFKEPDKVDDLFNSWRK